jgi:hypothetical protein
MTIDDKFGLQKNDENVMVEHNITRDAGDTSDALTAKHKHLLPATMRTQAQAQARQTSTASSAEGREIKAWVNEQVLSKDEELQAFRARFLARF